MALYTRPDVYVSEELRAPVRSTSTAPDAPVGTFVGAASKGPDGEAGPMLVNSWTEYQQIFGGFGMGTTHGLAYAVHQFFIQGGGSCVRAARHRRHSDGCHDQPRRSQCHSGGHAEGRRLLQGSVGQRDLPRCHGGSYRGSFRPRRLRRSRGRQQHRRAVYRPLDGCERLALRAGSGEQRARVVPSSFVSPTSHRSRCRQTTLRRVARSSWLPVSMAALLLMTMSPTRSNGSMPFPAA